MLLTRRARECRAELAQASHDRRRIRYHDRNDAGSELTEDRN
jgi:hypothetical protein